MEAALQPVVDQTNAHRATFEEFCRSLSGEELGRAVPASSWLVRDFIAHLATIDIWVAEWFEHLADGARWRPPGEGGEPFNIDTWNERHVQERRPPRVAQPLAEAAGYRDRLWAAVDRFTLEVLEKPFDFRGHTITHQRYMELWAGHDPAHSADMLRALPERLEEPAIAAWVAPFVQPPPRHDL
jgi:hypothetical protein